VTIAPDIVTLTMDTARVVNLPTLALAMATVMAKVLIVMKTTVEDHEDEGQRRLQQQAAKTEALSTAGSM
jgi:hypothetical protein